ncbi:MAG: hypothetical protein [Bacteriophage sp.]|nr:MAG: hypothetical protein [Bacteriophage sp.]
MAYPKRKIGVDTEDTGLDIEVRISTVVIDFDNQQINGIWKEQLVTPTGKPIGEVRKEGAFIRKDLVYNKKWSDLQASVVGQTILGMLGQDLINYPNLEQSDNPPA